MDDSRRFGRFTAPAQWAHEFRTDLKRIMGLCIVFRAEHQFHSNRIEYWAASEQFRAVPPGEVIPEYRWILSTDAPPRAEEIGAPGVAPCAPDNLEAFLREEFAKTMRGEDTPPRRWAEESRAANGVMVDAAPGYCNPVTGEPYMQSTNPLQRVLAGLDYFLMVKEERRFIEGARAELALHLAAGVALGDKEMSQANVRADIDRS